LDSNDEVTWEGKIGRGEGNVDEVSSGRDVIVVVRDDVLVRVIINETILSVVHVDITRSEGEGVVDVCGNHWGGGREDEVLGVQRVWGVGSRWVGEGDRGSNRGDSVNRVDSVGAVPASHTSSTDLQFNSEGRSRDWIISETKVEVSPLWVVDVVIISVGVSVDAASVEVINVVRATWSVSVLEIDIWGESSGGYVTSEVEGSSSNWDPDSEENPIISVSKDWSWVVSGVGGGWTHIEVSDWEAFRGSSLEDGELTFWALSDGWGKSVSASISVRERGTSDGDVDVATESYVHVFRVTCWVDVEVLSRGNVIVVVRASTAWI